MVRSTLTAVALLTAAQSFSPLLGQSMPASSPLQPDAPGRIAVPTLGGTAQLAVYVSADWTQPRPEATRAVMVFHGVRRNADTYFATGLKARAAAGPAAASTLIIAPQFLATSDGQAHELGADTLVWRGNDWSGGADAVAPLPVSAFSAVDAILEKLADRTLFPHLAHVVIAGHSGGGQFVQRYAAVGKGEKLLSAPGVHVRYVVANPSSYLYFTPQRPGADGHLAAFSGARSCPTYNDWKYGLARGTPRYLDEPTASYEAGYARRDVVYLLGDRDNDPNHPLLDKSCMGEAQGPDRYARGHWYFAQMQTRLAESFVHQLHDIAGVGHDNLRMFRSSCGIAALFDAGTCP